MGIVARWDGRSAAGGALTTGLVPATDGTSVIQLTALAGTTNLDNNCGASFPTYNAANDALVFSADASAIGSASLAAALAAVPQGAAWSIFCLVNESSFGAGMLCGFGNGADNTRGVLIRDDATGAVTALVRDSGATNNAPTTSGTRATSTWYVAGLVYNGTNIVVSIDGANTGSTARTANIAGDSWNQFAIGAFFRDNIGVHANGLYREVRVYDSNETANYATIVASMLAGGGPSGGTDIDGALESITLTTFPALTGNIISIAGALEAISLATSAATVTGIPPAPSITGPTYVTLGTPNATAANRITAVADLASGNLLAYGDIVGSGTVVVNTDATFDAAITVTGFDVQVWDGSWGNVGLQAIDNSAGLESISLATFQASISSTTNIAAALESISLATSAAQILLGALIQGAVENLSVATFDAVITGELSQQYFPDDSYSNQGNQQGAFRALSLTTLDYNGDFIAAMQADLADDSGNINGLMIRWLQQKLSSSNQSLPGLMVEAAIDRGVSRWQEILNPLEIGT
jgi:hypothetical protein